MAMSEVPSVPEPQPRVTRPRARTEAASPQKLKSKANMRGHGTNQPVNNFQAPPGVDPLAGFEDVSK